MQSFLLCAPHFDHGQRTKQRECEWTTGIKHDSFVHRAHFEWGPEGDETRVSRVFALSDPHGDARLVLRSLIEIGVVVYKKGQLVWEGGTALVVICGDLIDDCRVHCAHEAGADVETRRMEIGSKDGSNEWEVLALLNLLVANGARIVWVLGNHEHMRMMEQQEGHYQRHVSRSYEERFMPGAWKSDGTMRRLFGPLRVAVSVGNALFLHADPVAPHFRHGGTRTYNSVREYVEDVNRLVQSKRGPHGSSSPGYPQGISDRRNSRLVWGRKAGHEYTDDVCAEITRHIRGPVLVVRGHCVTGDSSRTAGRSIAWNPATRDEHFVSTNEYKKEHETAGITFGCLRFDNGVVSGIARVDCGASASMQIGKDGKHKLMSVLEIETTGTGNEARVGFALTEHRFRVDAKTRTSGPKVPVLHRPRSWSSPRGRRAHGREAREARQAHGPTGREGLTARRVYGGRHFYTPAGA